MNQLSSLYIGNGEKEERLYTAIEDFLARGGKALIILDYNRGQRGKLSSRAFLSEIKQKYPGNLKLKVSSKHYTIKIGILTPI